MNLIELKDLISKSKTEKVIDILLKALKDNCDFSENYHTIILLSSQFQEIKHKELLGISLENQQDKARITYALISLIDRLIELKFEIQSDTISDFELFGTRKNCFGKGYEKWFDIVENAKEVVIINGLSRYFWDTITSDVEFRNRFSKIVTNPNLSRFLIIWDSIHNQAERYFFIKQTDTYYSTDDNMSLDTHLNDKYIKPVAQIVTQILKYPKIELKILPFTSSYTILKVDNQLFVSFLGIQKGSESPTIKLLPKNNLLYNHFNNIVNHLITSELIDNIKIINNKIVIPELLQIVNQKGELLTKLPRKYVEKQNREHNKLYRKDFAHRHIYGLVISDQNNILIQKRASNKDNPDLWDKSVGGHVDFCETTITTCKRELFEELGLKFIPKKHKIQILYQQIEPQDHERIVPNPTENILENMCFDLFIITNVSENEIKIDDFEVKGYLWVTIDKLKQLSQTDEVTYDLKKIVNNLNVVEMIDGM